MAGADDLVARAQPYLYAETIYQVAGTDWVWYYDGDDHNGLRDDDGDLVVWTGCSIVANVYGDKGVHLLALDATFPAAGTIKIASENADNDDLATPGGDDVFTRHEIMVTTGTGKKFLVAGADGASLVIRAQAG